MKIKNNFDVPFCDENEEKELVSILNNLSEDDLSIVKMKIIKL